MTGYLNSDSGLHATPIKNRYAGCVSYPETFEKCSILFKFKEGVLKMGSSLPLTLINFEQGSTVDLTPFLPHFRSQVNMSAEELSKLAEKLKEMVGRFRI